MFSLDISSWWSMKINYAHGLAIHQESFQWMFVMMGFWLVLLGQGTLNALILVAIKSHYFKEDVRSWKTIIFFNFLLTILVYGMVLLLYQLLNQWFVLQADFLDITSRSTFISIISYAVGQIMVIFYCVRLAKKLDL